MDPQAIGVARALAASANQNAVFQRLLSNMPAPRQNPIDLPLQTEQPAITLHQGYTSGISVEFAADASPAPFNVLGMDAYQGQNLDTVNHQLPMVSGAGIEFMLDAPKFDLHTNGNANSTQIYTVTVDGQLLSKPTSLSYALPTINPNVGSGDGFALFDYTALSTPRRFRRFVLRFAGPIFKGIRIGPTDTIFAPERTAPKVLSIGDSFNGLTGCYAPDQGFNFILAARMGWDLWLDCSSPGGTGYIAPSGGLPNAGSYIQRLTDPTAALHWTKSPVAPSAVLIEGSGNDESNGAAAVQAAAFTFYQALRTQLPGIPFFVLGTNGSTTGPNSQTLTTEAAVQAAVAQQQATGDKLIYFIPENLGIPKPWFYGTGTVGAPNGSGNNDYFGGGSTGTDATHPNPAGHDMMARRIQAAIMPIIQAGARGRL